MCVLRVGRRPYFTRLLLSHRQVGLSDLTTPEEVNAIILAEEGAVVAFISRAYEVSTPAAYGDRPISFYRLSHATSLTVPDDLRMPPLPLRAFPPHPYLIYPCGNWRYRLTSQHRDFSELIACPLTAVQHASCRELSSTRTTASPRGGHSEIERHTLLSNADQGRGRKCTLNIYDATDYMECSR